MTRLRVGLLGAAVIGLALVAAWFVARAPSRGPVPAPAVAIDAGTPGATEDRAAGLAPEPSPAARPTAQHRDREAPSSVPERPAPRSVLSSTPGEVTVTAGPGNRVVLAWAAPSGGRKPDGYLVERDDARIAMVEGTRYEDQRLQPLREYCYRVRAHDAKGTMSEAAGPACLTLPDTTPPTTPGDVTAKVVGDRSVAVSWAASRDDVGVDHYEAVRSSGASVHVVRTTETALRVDDLAPGTTVCHAIRACDGAGNCSPDSKPACATSADQEPPSTPVVSSAKARPDTGVELRWEPAHDNVGVVAYEVRRGEELIVRTDRTAVVDLGATPGERTCYTVRAVDAADNVSAPSAPACAVAADVTPPTAPGRLEVTALSTSELYLAWDAAEDDVGVEGYEVLRKGAVVARTKARHAREGRLSRDSEYCYEVRAFDRSGNRSPAGGPACGRTMAAAGEPAITDLRGNRLQDGRVELQWNPVLRPGIVYQVLGDGATVVTTGANTVVVTGSRMVRYKCFAVVAGDPAVPTSPRSPTLCLP